MVIAGFTLPVYLIVLLIILAVWEGVWKAIGLWKSARNSHLWWFIFILILNTAGILPIVYIFAVDKSKKKKLKK